MLHRRPEPNFLGQTKILESQHEIVSPENDLHVSGVGPETASRDFGHEHRVFEFVEEEFLVDRPQQALKPIGAYGILKI